MSRRATIARHPQSHRARAVKELPAQRATVLLRGGHRRVRVRARARAVLICAIARHRALRLARVQRRQWARAASDFLKMRQAINRALFRRAAGARPLLRLPPQRSERASARMIDRPRARAQPSLGARPPVEPPAATRRQRDRAWNVRLDVAQPATPVTSASQLAQRQTRHRNR